MRVAPFYPPGGRKLLALIALVALPAAAQEAAPVEPRPSAVPPAVEVGWPRCDNKDASGSPSESRFEPKGPYASDAKISCDPKGVPQHEDGVKDGFAYRIYYADGSGRVRPEAEPDPFFDGWGWGCKIDNMTDRKWCHIDRYPIMLSYEGGTRWTAHVGGEAYPGSQIAIRFGDAPPLRALEDGFPLVESRRIVEALKKPGRVRSQWHKWPSGIGEGDFDSAGFSQALDLMLWVRSNL